VNFLFDLNPSFAQNNVFASRISSIKYLQGEIEDSHLRWNDYCTPISALGTILKHSRKELHCVVFKKVILNDSINLNDGIFRFL